jgi:hypothetical protein
MLKEDQIGNNLVDDVTMPPFNSIKK